MNGNPAIVACLGDLSALFMAGQTAVDHSEPCPVSEVRRFGEVEPVVVAARKWGMRLTSERKRPLRCMTTRALQSDAVHGLVRVMLGLETLGEARDMVGRELQIRLGMGLR